ncbi:MAG: T9SS type A sorting domain-containing protein, partial [Bacteroidota bacterium]
DEEIFASSVHWFIRNDVLEIHSSKIIRDLYIYDISGRLVRKAGHFEKDSRYLNLSNFQSGIYTGIVIFEQERPQAIKFFSSN